MDEEAIKILREVSNFDKISIYDFIEHWSKIKKMKTEDNFDQTVRLVYQLAASGLIEISSISGSDGEETTLGITSNGETYLRSSIAQEGIKQ